MTCSIEYQEKSSEYEILIKLWKLVSIASGQLSATDFPSDNMVYVHFWEKGDKQVQRMTYEDFTNNLNIFQLIQI